MAKVYVRMAKPHFIFKDEGVDPKTKKPYDIHLTGYDPVDGHPNCPVFHVELTPMLRKALNEGTEATSNDQSEIRIVEIRDEDEAREIRDQQNKDREERLAANPIQQMPTMTVSEEVYNRLLALASRAAPTEVANLALPATAGNRNVTTMPGLHGAPETGGIPGTKIKEPVERTDGKKPKFDPDLSDLSELKEKNLER